MTVEKFPERHVPSIVGPALNGNKVVVDGYVIPNMTCRDNGKTVEIIIDGRFNYEFPSEWAYLAAAMAAQAMSIGQGYSHMGAPDKNRPFAPMRAALDQIPRE